ncbi:segregation and condensation protein B [Micromonospora palomenae]|uniref:Segregation and condensation protein B n=1 Tax=Micromonospora palomenae TaxID=1461247 RepID=A0A561WXI5_9ACTN|nr:SMC-Scp complex subunit ScpB [Micromonospora palomenae]TWG28592.1 segregation and condensation protein B [Micromonospora palomenae]
MSDEERRDSLADQAAAWIPPWERPTPPRDEPAEPPVEASDEPGEASDEPIASAPAADLTEASGPAGDAEPTAASALPGDAEPPAVPAAPEDAEPTADPAPTAGPAPAGGADEPAGEGAAARVPGKQPAPRRRATPAPEPALVLDDAELRGALEAILLVVDEPVSELILAQVLEQPAERVGPMLDEIAAGYTAAGHGFELRRAAGGWRLYTRPEYATYVERFVLDGQSVRLTQAALETLAVIAYKQPVTRSRISAIRGVNCDGVIRTLVSRGLVEECGTEPDSGAFLYRTTTMFLEKLGLNSVDDLPPLAPFLPDDVEELADATR